MPTSISIPTCITPKYLTLINPLVHLFKEAVYRSNDTNDSIAESLDAILEEGLYISSNGEFCCPDCVDNKAFYFLGEINSFSDVIQALGLDAAAVSTKTLPCCVNKHLSSESIIAYNDLFVTPTVNKLPGCCNTGFLSAMQNLLNASDSDINLGSLIEVSSFGNKSGISIILDFLNTLTPLLTKAEIGDIFADVIAVNLKGIVIKCVGCDMFIANSQTFITIGEDIGFVKNN
jgi:hypothetical protein